MRKDTEGRVEYQDSGLVGFDLGSALYYIADAKTKT
jgi:hypothetical protein